MPHTPDFDRSSNAYLNNNEFTGCDEMPVAEREFFEGHGTPSPFVRTDDLPASKATSVPLTIGEENVLLGSMQ